MLSRACCWLLRPQPQRTASRILRISSNRRYLSLVKPKKLHIAYGSQSGTAMTFAALLLRDAKAHQLEARLSDLEEVTAGDIEKDELLVLVMATYGEGEPTDNAVDFYEWLSGEETRSECEEALGGVPFVVFGLGNSATYPERYNVVGKAVQERLSALGAQPLLPLGLGDAAKSAQRCVDDDFEEWKEELWKALEGGSEGKELGGGGDAASRRSSVMEGVAVTEHDPVSTCSEWDRFEGHERRANELESSYKKPVRMQCVQNRELHRPLSERSARHLEFDVSAVMGRREGGSAACVRGCVRYETGDHLGVIPEQDGASVLEFLDAMGLDPQRVISVDSSSPQHAQLTHPHDLFHVFSRIKCIHSPLSRHVLAALADVASGADRDLLLALSQRPPEGVPSVYDAVVVEQHRGMLDLVRMCPSLCGALPLGLLLELLPNVQVRFYSIASSALVQPDRVALSVSVVNKPVDAHAFHGTAMQPFLAALEKKRAIRGLCSSYLASLQTAAAAPCATARSPLSDSVAAFVRRSQFRLPPDPATPVVMVGAGAGIAPLRAFVQERMAMAARGDKLGEARLYFGCEHPDKDYLYQEELEAALDAGAITGLYPLFNEQPDANGAKWVQHRMKEHATQLYELLLDGAMVYVCGKGSTVGAGVRESLEHAFLHAPNAHYDAHAAYSAVGRLYDSGRVQQDVFA